MLISLYLSKLPAKSLLVLRSEGGISGVLLRGGGFKEAGIQTTGSVHISYKQKNAPFGALNPAIDEAVSIEPLRIVWQHGTNWQHNYVQPNRYLRQEPHCLLLG